MKKDIPVKKANVKINPTTKDIQEMCCDKCGNDPCTCKKMNKKDSAKKILSGMTQEMRCAKSKSKQMTEVLLPEDFNIFEVDYLTDEELLEICEEVIWESIDDTHEIYETLDLLETEILAEQDVSSKPEQSQSRIERVKTALKSAAQKVKSGLKTTASTAKKVAVKTGRAAGEVAGAAVAGYRSQAGQSKPKVTTSGGASADEDESSSSSGGSSSGTRTTTRSSSGSGGSSTLRKVGSAVKAGLKKVIGKVARVTSKVGDKVATRMGEEIDLIGFNEFQSYLLERDFWHPDPEQDRKLGGPGANQRAREDAAERSKPKEDPKKLRPGESYMDYSKRQSGTTTSKPVAKPSFRDKLKNKLGNAIDRVAGLNNSFESDGEVLESAVPGKPAERLGAVTAIPSDEREAAKQRTLAKAAALRKKREEQKEEFEIEEGMTMKDFKANRQKNKRRAASADAEKRGHVGKEWYNSGRKYSPDEAKRSRANMDDEERRTRHRSAVDPDNEDDNNYSADKTKNPKKQRKQAAMGEMMSFSDFMEARAEDKRGLEPTGANRKKQKTGVTTSSGQVAHPATSYSGGQNPHTRGKEGKTKEQRRAASRRYVDQPGGVYAKPENKQGEGRYAVKQAKKRDQSHMSSRFD